jgi:glucuronate isomerase
VKFYLTLSALAADAEQHRRIYQEFAAVQDIFAGNIPSMTLTSLDLSTPTEEEEYFDDNTMFKVHDAIMESLPMNSAHARDIIERLQNAGILFRERRTSGSHDQEGTG